MESPHFSSRQRVAVGLGVSSLIALLALLMTGGPSRFRTPSEPPVIVTTGTVQTGDVFWLMLKNKGLDPIYLGSIQKTLGKKLDIQKIQPGNHYEIVTSTTGVFKKFTYRIDPAHSYVVTRSSTNVYEALEVEQQTVWIERRIAVEVTKFLDWDLRAAGYDNTLINNMTYELSDIIFGWRIDFLTEQRKGDKLDILLEEQYIVGEDKPLRGGKHMRVIVASYTGSGTRTKENLAVRYQSPDAKRPDYFDTDGKAMRRQFLRAPFTKANFRISSGFNRKRMHPILRVHRPHHGTDYAAPIGTPVAAIGGGTVVRADWYKGYGNCVDIQHNGRYTSRYGHLSRINVKRGQRVDQGNMIGRVGNTGLSTGPHLHFEMLENGTQRNFLTMYFPALSAVSKDNMPDFLRVKDEALARLSAREIDKPKALAMNPTASK